MVRIAPRIEAVAGNVAVVRSPGARYGELATVGQGPQSSPAQVIRIDGDRVHLQVFQGTGGVSTGDAVRFSGRFPSVSVEESLLGRVFSASGLARDRGPRLETELREIGGPSVNPVCRQRPSRMLRTDIPMIDVFNTLVESQKISVFTVSGEPYNELLARIALQAECDVIILGGVGLRHDDFLYFQSTLEEAGALSRSVLFIHTAADPVVECLLVPDTALCVAEAYALSGKRVLVLLNDMTNYSDALKEVSIIMEQIPSNRGYPGDLYTRLASIYERAVDFAEAGSVTILSVTTMPGNDVTHPVPDNTGYITEGQYYLYNGRIEPFGSLSRLKQQVNKDTRADHRGLMDGMIRLYAVYQETLEKRAMGFRMSDWDQKLLRYGREFESRLMNLSVRLPLEQALDEGWKILAESFQPDETGLRTDLIEQFWPGKR